MTATATPATESASRPDRQLIEVVLSGDLPECARGWALDEVEAAVTPPPFPLTRATVTLRRAGRGSSPCRADIAVDLDGHLIHGRGVDVAPRAALRAAAGRVHVLAQALAHPAAG